MRSSGNIWIIFGWVFLAVSVVMLLIGFEYETSVAVEYETALPGYQTTQTVENLGLLVDKMLIFLSGLALGVVGIISICAGSILKSLSVIPESEV